MLASRYVLRSDAGRTEAHVAFTDRRGGYSSGPYGTFNLAHHVGDEPESVDANRAMLASALGVEALVFTNQVHGNRVVTVTKPPQPSDPPFEGDALVTTLADLPLCIMVADCTPVMLADPDAGVIGAVHAGRGGLAAGVVPGAIAAMKDLGASSIRAVVGPSICPRCYEVPAALRAEVAAVEPVAAAVSATGTPALDVASGVVEQLHREGVDVRWVPGCTRESADLFSYRRDKATGRFAGLIWLRS